MNQQKWREKAYNEWVGRTTGSRLNMDQARGADNTRRADAAARARWQDIPKPPRFSPPVVSAPVPQNSPVAMGPVEGPRVSQRTRTSTSSTTSASRALALVGALVGYGYGSVTNAEVPWLYALAGGVAGAFALDVLAFAFKLVKLVVVTILTLVCLAVALYLLAILIGS